MSARSKAKLLKATNAVGDVVSCLEALNANAEEAKYIAEHSIEPAGYPKSVAQDAVDVAKRQSNEWARLDADLATVLADLGSVTQHANADVAAVRHEFAGVLDDEHRAVGGITESSLHASVVAFAECVLTQAAGVAEIKPPSVESTRVPVEELLPPATLKEEQSIDGSLHSRSPSQVNWMDNITPESLTAIRTWTIVEMMGFGKAGLNIPDDLADLRSRLEAEIGSAIRNCGSDRLREPEDASQESFDMPRSEVQKRLVCAAGTINKRKQGKSMPDGFRQPDESEQESRALLRWMFESKKAGREEMFCGYRIAQYQERIESGVRRQVAVSAKVSKIMRERDVRD